MDDSATGAKAPLSPSSRPVEGRKPSDDLPAGAPDGLRQAADAKPGTDPYEGEDGKEAARKEAGALEFLLGAEDPLPFSVKAKLDTRAGQKSVTFHLRQIDGDRIVKLEEEHRKGSGPFAEVDDIRLEAAIVYEAAKGGGELEDETGRRIPIESPEFAGRYTDPKIALEKRFQFQPGVLQGVAGQVRAMAGYVGNRVEAAEATIERAAGGS